MKYKLILFFLCIHVTSYFSQCLPHEKELSIVIQPDFFASETSWELFENNNLILSGTHHGDSVCIDSTACIQFVINDSGNDGLCCAFGNGYYEVFIQGNKIGNGAVFFDSDTTRFNCPIIDVVPENDGVFIPTAFSPNQYGNAQNEQFAIIVDETVESVDFFIYDRWGVQVFSSANIYFSWDGKFKNEECSSGIYAYQALVIYVDGTKKIKTGNISLFR